MPRVTDAEHVVRYLERARVDHAEISVGDLKVPKLHLLKKHTKKGTITIQEQSASEEAAAAATATAAQSSKRQEKR